jgi:Spy/CpxP family protein refolding chaperone
MKTSRIVLFFVGAALIVLPARIAVADDAPAAGSTIVPAGDKAARMEKMKAALAQLDLTDDQKAKIKDIFTNVPAGKERRQQIVAVLTPDQKEKLKSIIHERREAAQTNGAATTPVAN